MAEKVKDLIRLVDKQLEQGDKFLALNAQYHQALKSLWHNVRDEVAKGKPTDELQKACEEAVKLWEKKHKYAVGMNFSDQRTHTIQSIIAQAIGLNEGGKCAPWNADC